MVNLHMALLQMARSVPSLLSLRGARRPFPASEARHTDTHTHKYRFLKRLLLMCVSERTSADSEREPPAGPSAPQMCRG